MRVFVVSDLEGVSAAVRGAKAAGATEIVVMDCQGAGDEWTFNLLVPDLLDESVSRTKY
jgi:D-amino peptidase